MAIAQTKASQIVSMDMISFFYVTCPDSENAERIARHLLENSLIACANIIPQMKSLYLWKGKIETSSEVILLLKSKAELRDSIEAEIKKIHPYEIPCIAEIPLHSLNEEYLHWLKSSFSI